MKPSTDDKATGANGRQRSETTEQTVYEAVRRMIAEGASPGTKLPTERAMARMYQTDRNIVRRALNRLSDHGFVTRHVGRGTFVADPDVTGSADKSAAPTHPKGPFSLLDIVEARLLFEPGMAELAAERAMAEDFDAIDRHLAEMRHAKSIVEFKEARFQLHLAIARSSKNDLLVAIFQMIIDSRRMAGWGGHPDRRYHGLQERRAEGMRDYTALVDALRARDARAVSDLLKKSLSDILMVITTH